MRDMAYTQKLRRVRREMLQDAKEYESQAHWTDDPQLAANLRAVAECCRERASRYLAEILNSQPENLFSSRPAAHPKSNNWTRQRMGVSL